MGEDQNQPAPLSDRNQPNTFLAGLVGNWRGLTRTWFEPGKLADESETRGRIRAVLDGRFVVHEYEGSLRGKPLMGMAILGYHVDAGRFTMAWVDSFHMGTATMHAEGEPRDQGFSLLGSYDVPQSEPWGWRTEYILANNDAQPDHHRVQHLASRTRGQGGRDGLRTPALTPAHAGPRLFSGPLASSAGRGSRLRGRHSLCSRTLFRGSQRRRSELRDCCASRDLRKSSSSWA